MTPLPTEINLPISISLESSTPLYDQIVTQVRTLIVANTITAGTQLPSVRALATALGCSVITTRRAYQELEQQGLIRTFQGRGTIVADVPQQMREQHRLALVDRALRVAIDEARSAGVGAEELRTLLNDILAERGEQ